MKTHREGTTTIILVIVFLIALNYLFVIWTYSYSPIIYYLFLVISISFLVFIMSFFRIPQRLKTKGENLIISPADGKVVVIEKVKDEEYFNDERIQVSIFMSPLNVHQNLVPISGTVNFSQYFKGKYLVAFNPKSSTENERHSIVIKTPRGTEILVKQIAGAVARRIVNYADKGFTARQGEEFGFIKFGSRVDVLLPLDATIKSHTDQKVKGGVSVLAELK